MARDVIDSCTTKVKTEIILHFILNVRKIISVFTFVCLTGADGLWFDQGLTLRVSVQGRVAYHVGIAVYVPCMGGIRPLFPFSSLYCYRTGSTLVLSNV